MSEHKRNRSKRRKLRKLRRQAKKERIEKVEQVTPSNQNRHHRRPKSRGGGGGDNIIKIDKTMHRQWHLLFGNKTPQQIATTINAIYLCKRYKFVVEER